VRPSSQQVSFQHSCIYLGMQLLLLTNSLLLSAFCFLLSPACLRGCRRQGPHGGPPLRDCRLPSSRFRPFCTSAGAVQAKDRTAQLRHRSKRARLACQAGGHINGLPARCPLPAQPSQRCQRSHRVRLLVSLLLCACNPWTLTEGAGIKPYSPPSAPY
jgi:hypothetical protein